MAKKSETRKVESKDPVQDALEHPEVQILYLSGWKHPVPTVPNVSELVERAEQLEDGEKEAWFENLAENVDYYRTHPDTRTSLDPIARVVVDKVLKLK
jgi:hypothetical protein